MAEKSAIQWTDATWNPWHGCTKVSPGCKYCYMYRDKDRWGHDPKTVMRSKSNFTDPLKWKEPRKIFTCSWSDWFIKDADQWRDEAWDIIRKTPQHTYQILTKRPERIVDCLPDDWGQGYPNVWLGISVEDQERADERIPLFCNIPAKVKFISFEPLIGYIDLTHKLMDGILWDVKHVTDGSSHFELILQIKNIDWAIIGGESGNDNGKWKYRYMDLSWARRLASHFQLSQIPVFVKQLGTYQAKKLGMSDRHGGKMDEFPDYLQVREFPKLCTT